MFGILFAKILLDRKQQTMQEYVAPEIAHSSQPSQTMGKQLPRLTQGICK